MRIINYNTMETYVKAIRKAADHIEYQLRNGMPIGAESMHQYGGRSIVKKTAYAVCVSFLISGNFSILYHSNWEMSETAGVNDDIIPLSNKEIYKFLKAFKKDEAYKILEYPKFMSSFDTIPECILRYKNGSGFMFTLEPGHIINSIFTSFKVPMMQR